MTGESISLSVRGLPEWLIRDYLADLGARADDDAATLMRAPHWSVSWTSRRVPIDGSGALTLTQWDMVFAGEPTAAADAHRRFLAKAQRGGG